MKGGRKRWAWRGKEWLYRKNKRKGRGVREPNEWQMRERKMGENGFESEGLMYGNGLREGN